MDQKAPDENYSHMCEMYKTDNKTINNYKFHWLLSQKQLNRFPQSNLHWKAFIKQFLMIYHTLYRDQYLQRYKHINIVI